MLHKIQDFITQRIVHHGVNRNVQFIELWVISCIKAVLTMYPRVVINNLPHSYANS